MLPFKSQKCRLTSPYDWRIHPITKHREFHHGIDIVAVGGDEVVSVCDGRVVMSRMVLRENDTGNTWQWGNYIAIQGTDGNIIYYCHLAERYAVAGQTVRAGDVIGLQGATGQVTGKHLHFEVRGAYDFVNAADYLGIDNKVGIYDEGYTAINKLAKIGVINSPDYWHQHYKDIAYLDTLLIRCADKIKKSGVPCASLDTAFDKLVKSGIINTPEYWKNNIFKVQYLSDLIKKLGGSV